MVEKWSNYNTQFNSHLNILCEDCTAKDDIDNLIFCEKCSAQLTQIAYSIIEKSSTHEGTNSFPESKFPHELRSDVIDALLVAYNFAQEITAPALAARQWLESHSLNQCTDNIHQEETQPLSSIQNDSEGRETLRLDEELKIPSMLSNSSDSIDVSSVQDNSLILCPIHPVVVS